MEMRLPQEKKSTKGANAEKVGSAELIKGCIRSGVKSPPVFGLLL